MLAVSRSFGDFQYKAEASNLMSLDFGRRGGNNENPKDFVLCEPEARL